MVFHSSFIATEDPPPPEILQFILHFSYSLKRIAMHLNLVYVYKFIEMSKHLNGSNIKFNLIQYIRDQNYSHV